MPHARQALGAAGEAAARRYLRAHGLRILGQNVRVGGVEIDVIAERGRTVVFVEVKTRRGDTHGSGAEAVDARKRAQILKGARAWLGQQRRRPRRVRFDVVTCTPRPTGGFEVAHWPAAFDADG